MRALRKYVLVTVSSNVNASLSSSTTRGLTGCTSDSQFGLGVELRRDGGVPLGSDRAMLAHQVAQGGDTAPTGAAGPGLARDVRDAARAVGDRLEDVAIGDDGAVAHVHGALALPVAGGDRVPDGPPQALRRRLASPK